MKTFLGSVRTEAWRTSSARYNAARRLRRRELFGTVSLTFFSALSVAIAFVQRIYVQNGTPGENYLTALSGTLGVFLLAISLMEWGSANGAKAAALYKNAEDLNAFQRLANMTISQIDSGLPVSWDKVNDLRAKYEDIKAQCPYNHEPLDELLFRASHRTATEFRVDGKPVLTQGAAWGAWIRWQLASVWYLGLSWIAVFLALAGAFCVIKS